MHCALAQKRAESPLAKKKFDRGFASVKGKEKKS
jgi:hypothetical protein